MFKKPFIMLVITLLAASAIMARNNLQLSPSITNHAITVELYLVNQDTLSGMQIPLDLGLSKLGLQLDSVSFAGSRIGHFYECFYTEYPEQDKVFIFILESANAEINSSPLLPGSGKIATIHLKRVRTPLASEHTFTTRSLKDENRDFKFYFWNNHGDEVEVNYEPLRLNARQ